MRRYEGQLRFRLDVAEDSAIRALLDRLAAEWNAGDVKAVEELAVRAGDTPKAPPEPGPSLREQLAQGAAEPWHMELEPEVKHIRFLSPDAVSVGHAKAGRIQGTVILDCLGTAEGKVTSVRLLRGINQLLDAAAIEAVRQWEYDPRFWTANPCPSS